MWGLGNLNNLSGLSTKVVIFMGATC